MVQHELTCFENYLSLFIQIISTIWRATLQTRKLCKSENNIQKLQNQVLRKISFKKLHDPVKPFFEDLKILKFRDLLRLQNYLFASQIEENQTLGKSFATLKHCGDNHNYQTTKHCGDNHNYRASPKRILDTPLYKTNTRVFVLIQQNIIVLRIKTSLK